MENELLQQEPVTEETSTTQAPETEQKQVRPQEKHFSELREARARAERERDEALRLLKEYEARQQPQATEDDFELAPDALAEGKHLSKVDKKIKKLQEELRNYQQQTTQMTIEAQLKAQYPDFDAIVTEQALTALRAQYPQVAQTLTSSGDLYNKAVSAYTLIKKLGLQPNDLYEEDRQRVSTNNSKPKSAASLSPQQGESPLANVNAFSKDYSLSKELRAQLHKEMIDSIKNH